MDALIGKKYGMLKIISIAESDSGNNKRYNCLCDCGNKTVTYRSSILKGIESCGCKRNKRTGKRSTTHGMSNTPTYYSYQSMIRRCTNIKSDNYQHYGGRGVKVCDRWLESFTNFYEDMGVRPENKTLDRIDFNGNYEPSNCRWADKITQSLNKRQRKGKTGLNNIQKNKNGYSVGIARQGVRRRKSGIEDLECAIKLRDLWVKEYEENKEKWLKDTNNNSYMKETGDEFKWMQKH